MSKPDLLITVTDVKITLHTRAGVVGELANTAEHIGAELYTMLAVHKPRTALMLLETSDVHMQTETLPRASWYDQRKLVARRLDLMFPNIELRAAIALPDDGDNKRDYFFMAVPHAPQLTAIYNALAKAQTFLAGVCVFAAEVWGLHQRAEPTGKHKNRVTLLNLDTHVRLLAEEPNALSLTRLLPIAAATNPQLCDQELQTTQSYLLRRGWSANEPYTLRTYRIPAAADFAMRHNVMHEVIDANAQPFTALVHYLLAGNKPFCALRPQRLRQRQQALQIDSIISKSLRIATVGVLLAVGINAGAWALLHQRGVKMQSQLATLPTPNTVYARTQAAANFFAAQPDLFTRITPLATTLPPYAYLTDLHYANGALDVTITGLPEAEYEAFIAMLAQRTGTTVTPANAANTNTGQLGAAAPEASPLSLKIGGM